MRNTLGGGRRYQSMVQNASMWDVFISYASEDREAVARPLAELLSGLGVSVWFDQQELCVGDSLRQRIDDGLAKSRFGVVILSEAFFSRHWPQQELNGLSQREVEGRKVILPVWHGVTVEDVRRYSPILADRVGARSEEGIPGVLLKLIQVIRPDIFDSTSRKAKSSVLLPRITSGQVLSSIVGGAHAYLPLNEEPQAESEAASVGSFLQLIQDWGDIWDDIGAEGQVRAQYSLGQELRSLEESGFGVYAVRQKRRVTIGGDATDWSIAAVAVLRGFDRKPLLQGDSLFVERTTAAPEADAS